MSLKERMQAFEGGGPSLAPALGPDSMTKPKPRAGAKLKAAAMFMKNASKGADAEGDAKPAPKWGQAKKTAPVDSEPEQAEPKPPSARPTDSETKAAKLGVAPGAAGGSDKSAVFSPWATAAVKGKGVAKFLLKAKQAQSNLESKQQAAAAAAVTPGAPSNSSNGGESTVPAWKRDLAKKTKQTSKDSVSGSGAVDSSGGASAPYPASPEQPPEPLDASYADYDANEGSGHADAIEAIALARSALRLAPGGPEEKGSADRDEASSSLEPPASAVFSPPPKRNGSRSNSAHNTAGVDGNNGLDDDIGAGLSTSYGEATYEEGAAGAGCTNFASSPAADAFEQFPAHDEHEGARQASSVPQAHFASPRFSSASSSSSPPLSPIGGMSGPTATPLSPSKQAGAAALRDVERSQWLARKWEADHQVQRAAVAQAQMDARAKTGTMTSALDKLKLAINPFGVDKPRSNGDNSGDGSSSNYITQAEAAAAANDRLERIKLQLQEAAAGSYQDEGATDEFGQFNYRQQDNERFGMARDAPGHHEHAGRGKALILRVARGERPRASADRVDDGGWHNNANEEFDPYSGLSPGSDFKGGGRGSQGGRRHGGGIGIDDDDDDEDARSEVSSPESSGRSDGGDSVDLNIFGGRRPPSSRSGRAPASSPVPPQAPRASPLHPDEMNVGGASGQDEEKSEQSMGATARRARSKDQVAASNGGKHGDEVSDGAAARTAAAMADALAAHPVPTPIIFRGPMTVERLAEDAEEMATARAVAGQAPTLDGLCSVLMGTNGRSGNAPAARNWEEKFLSLTDAQVWSAAYFSVAGGAISVGAAGAGRFTCVADLRADHMHVCFESCAASPTGFCLALGATSDTCLRIAPKRYQALLEWGAVLVQTLNELPSPVTAPFQKAPPSWLSGARPSLFPQQQQQQQEEAHYPSTTSQMQTNSLPSWARDDDDDQDGTKFRDENQPPPQSRTGGFNIGGGGGNASNGSNHATGVGDHKKEVSAESWAEMYRKQRANRRKGGAK